MVIILPNDVNGLNDVIINMENFNLNQIEWKRTVVNLHLPK